MRSRRNLALIQRPRLQERLAATPIVVLEAPGGYGKTLAWTELAAALDVATVRVILRRSHDLNGLLSSIAAAARRAGLMTLADAVDADDPEASLGRFTDRLEGLDRRVLVAVDEVHRASPEGASWLAALASELSSNTRLVIAGRRMDSVLGAIAGRHDATMVGVGDLRFDRDEVHAVLVSSGRVGSGPDEVDAVLAATDGWPAAVALVVAGDIAPDREVAVDARAQGTVLRRLVDGLLGATDRSTRELVAAITDLPLLSAPVVAAVGGEGALDRLLDAGMPIRFRPDGWGELADPVRELFPRQTLPMEQARAIARLYAGGGELVEATALLHRGGDTEGAVALLAGERRESLQLAGLTFFDAALSDTSDESHALHPTALVQLIRAAERQSRLRAAWIERATRVFPPGTPWQRAVEAERSLDVARGGDLEGGKKIAEDVIAAAGADEIVTRARAHFAHGLCVLIIDTAGNTTELVDELEVAIGLYSLAGERGWEAEAQQTLGYGIHYSNGAFDLATERLDRALALRPAPDAARAVTLTYVAEVLMQQDRLDDAAVALRESSSIGHRLGDSRSIAYAAWSTASLAARRRDRESAYAALDEAEAHPEGWFERLAGVEFLGFASEVRTIFGDEPRARRDLARAEARGRGTVRASAALAAQVRLEVVFGDPAEGLRALDELDESAIAYRLDRWFRILLRAACTARMGDPAGASILVARARQAAATDLDDPDRPARREPEIYAIAMPEEVPQETAATTTVALLGGFQVERGGVDITPPSGGPATLVKLVALQGRATVDEAIDVLWPDADFDTGRARLRNLLNRIRGSSGELIDRRDGVLVLADGVSVDATRFEEEAAAAISASLQERAGLARRALVRSTGELLPGDRYAEWTMVQRERIRRRHLALVDLVVEDAIARGDLDEADRLLDTAISSDPLEEIRYVRLARALLAQGRVRRARRVADQAVAVANDLGAEPGDELQALLKELTGQGMTGQA